MRATVSVALCEGKPQRHRPFAGSRAGLVPHGARVRQLARERRPAPSYSAVGSRFGFPGPTLVPISRWYHAHERQRVFFLVMVPHSIDPDELFEGSPRHALFLPTGHLAQGAAEGLPAKDHGEAQCGRDLELGAR